MIDLFGHLKIDAPTMAKSKITYYGTVGFLIFILMHLFALVGLITTYFAILKVI